MLAGLSFEAGEYFQGKFVLLLETNAKISNIGCPSDSIREIGNYLIGVESRLALRYLLM